LRITPAIKTKYILTFLGALSDGGEKRKERKKCSTSTTVKNKMKHFRRQQSERRRRKKSKHFLEQAIREKKILCWL
jgi:hypothetical protein